MIRVVIEVWNEATRFSVIAQAKSVREAASTAATVYPNADVRVKFPIPRLSSSRTRLPERRQSASSDR